MGVTRGGAGGALAPPLEFELSFICIGSEINESLEKVSLLTTFAESRSRKTLNCSLEKSEAGKSVTHIRTSGHPDKISQIKIQKPSALHALGLKITL